MNANARSLGLANDGAQEALPDARTILQHSVGAAREAVADAKQEVSQQVQQAASGVRQSAKKVGVAVGAVCRDATEVVRERVEQGRQQLRDLQETGTSYVQSHPGRALFSALAVGLVAGAVCGVLTARRRAAAKAIAL
jgi:ElaB/YqjD/DUF883 family membrane-anchored ribosome-binding protein